jgi:hypothetical protein
MKPRCILVIPDSGPLNSLWTAGRLDLLTALNMPIVMIDEIYAEVTSDPNFPKDREVKAFLDNLEGNGLTVEETFVGRAAKLAREQGTFRSGDDLGDAAIAEFMANGVRKYVTDNVPVLLLFEDSDFRNVRFVRKPDNLHLLSTVAMLRGMERIGIIPSSDEIIEAMTKPKPPKQARALNDLPDGYEDEAIGGSVWEPTHP